MIALLFTCAFVLGPALYLGLVRRNGPGWPLAVSAAVLVGASLVLGGAFGPVGGPAVAPLLVSVALIWIAWILVLVLATQAVRRAYPVHGIQRWSRALGAMGTTVPWFGFAAAQMMVD